MEEQEIEQVSSKFGSGHRHSNLLDQFERLSFEIHLNQAILRRSLSETAAVRSAAPPRPPPEPAQVSRKGKRGWRKAATTPFRKAMRKLLKPFIASRRRERTNGGDDATSVGSFSAVGPYVSRRFSRSVRVS